MNKIKPYLGTVVVVIIVIMALSQIVNNLPKSLQGYFPMYDN